MILVLGATGTVGSEVVRQLLEARQSVRALVHTPEKASQVDEGAEVVVGDMEKPETLETAFAGVDRVFVLAPVAPNLVTLEANAYEAAKQAGVRHIVKLSQAGVIYDFLAETSLAQWHAQSEQRLQASGIAWTILRPVAFSSLFLTWGIKERGALYQPTGDGTHALIDPRDVAAVGVLTLTQPGHEGQAYELTGPELLSGAQIVGKMAAVLGKPLRFVDVPESAAREGLVGAGISAPLLDGFMAYFAAVKARRFRVTSTVADLLGRPARTFDEWLRDHRAELQ